MSTGSVNTPKASGATAGTAAAADPARWFIAEGSKPAGPFNDAGLLQLLREGKLAAQQRVINKTIGMTGWEPSGQVPHIEGLRAQIEIERRAVPRWQVAAGDKANGPFSDNDLQRMLQEGSLQDSSMVWRKGTSAWTKIADVRELDALRARVEQAALPPIPVENDAMPALPVTRDPVKVQVAAPRAPASVRAAPAALVRLQAELSALTVVPAVPARAVVERLNHLRKVPDPILLHNDVQKVVGHLVRAESQGAPNDRLQRAMGALREFRDEVAPAARRFNRDESLAARCTHMLKGSRSAAPRMVSLGSARL